jgi:hypothetical protein
VTASQLQNICRILSNNGWCRYWLNFYNTEKHVDMAIHCIDYKGTPQSVYGLEAKGFRHADAMGLTGVYIIKRTNDDGSDFESKVF